MAEAKVAHSKVALELLGKANERYKAASQGGSLHAKRLLYQICGSMAGEYMVTDEVEKAMSLLDSVIGALYSQLWVEVSGGVNLKHNKPYALFIKPSNGSR